MDRLLERRDAVLHEGRVGLLCNQTAFDPARGQYLFQALDQRRVLRRLFTPEHGLFAELQDQVGLAAGEVYRSLGLRAEVVSLYGQSEGTLHVAPDKLADLDALVVDVQDVGARYYTFATTLAYVFEALADQPRDLTVYVLDRPNPAGRQVEGTPLAAPYESFCGRPGLPHRHGLTIGELASFHQARTAARCRLEVLRLRGPVQQPAWAIPPSPNMPGPLTPLVYSGQCLLEATNVSEGRGTTRPFEVFGAPWLDCVWREAAPPAAGAVLRPTRFVPAFHKWAGQVCHGLQICPSGAPYHSLAHTLHLLRWVRERGGERFAWRTEAYEFRSDRPAIDLLAGDAVLLDYLHGQTDERAMHEALAAGEEQWLREARAFLLYDEELRRV